MDFFLIDPLGETFHFPVNPEEMRIRREKQYETATILSLGEVDLIQGQRVKEISFSSFFPKVYDSSYCRYPDIPSPQNAMNRITALLSRRDPVRLLITESAVNILVHVSQHDSTFKGGEPGDVYYDVTFRTWRDIKVRTPVSTDINRPDTKPLPKVYVVKQGDTLTGISKRELGDSSKWRVLYDINKLIIGSDYNLIKPGQKLVMP